MMQIKLTVNGTHREWTIRPDECLLETLRNNGYFSLRGGCNSGQCGICTVHLDGLPVLACLTLTAKTDGRSVTTLEGTGERGISVAKALRAEGVDQCGYCAPGTIMSILYLESVITNPTDDEILHHMSGNLCRCSGYSGQLRGIRRYLEGKAHENS